jgi:hypothetical protein
VKDSYSVQLNSRKLLTRWLASVITKASLHRDSLLQLVQSIMFLTITSSENQVESAGSGRGLAARFASAVFHAYLPGEQWR